MGGEPREGTEVQVGSMRSGLPPTGMPEIRVRVRTQVDHQQRRRHIGEAVLRLIASRGLEAASLRNVAAEAGVSMGTVQHYFTSKQEMLDFAQRHNYERATVRIPQLIAAVPEPRSARALLLALLIDLLGLEGESREGGARLGAAMLAYAVIDPQAAATARTACTTASPAFSPPSCVRRKPMANCRPTSTLTAPPAICTRLWKDCAGPPSSAPTPSIRPWPSSTTTSAHCSASPPGTASTPAIPPPPIFSEPRRSTLVRALANQTAKVEICGRQQIRYGKFVLPGD